MEKETHFKTLLDKAKQGDEDAAAELYFTYKDKIQRAARTRMFNGRLQRLFDSEDILQAVMKSFFARVSHLSTQWKMDTPADLVNLLCTMAKNKAVSEARSQETEKRGGKNDSSTLQGELAPSPEPSPSEIAAVKELAALCWDRLPAELRGLYKMRYDERMSWEEIGTLLGESSDTCSKRLSRGLEKIAKQFPNH